MALPKRSSVFPDPDFLLNSALRRENQANSKFEPFVMPFAAEL
jgi:hypothetical protein